MRHISVSKARKAHDGADLEREYISFTNYREWQLPIGHLLFEQIKNSMDKYVYIARFTGVVWRKTKYKDYYEYYDEELCDWVFDEEMNNSYAEYMDWGETLYKFVK